MMCMALLIEALTELFFKAAPLQGLRAWLITHTPTLNTRAQGHLLNCKYCTAVWISAGVIILNVITINPVLYGIAYIVIVSRLANFAHGIISTLRDYQTNLRLMR